jgi:hypothetical protein
MLPGTRRSRQCRDMRLPAIEDSWTRHYPGCSSSKRLLSGGDQSVHKAASTDAAVCRAFFDVANLLASPRALAHPRILTGVIRHATVDTC